MAVCVGCGLEVVGGLLQVHLKPNGGIICDNTNGLSVQFPATAPGDPKPANLGCGITADSTGKLIIDTCDNGGLKCGSIDGDTDNGGDCIYVDVQNQATGPVIPLATAQDPNVVKPNDCNGLVRTEQGLWAPPKTGMAASITSIGSLASSMSFILQTKNDIDFPPDHAGANEYLVGADIGHCILCFCFQNDTCNPGTGITLTRALIPLIVVEPGQSHRFTLWERLAFIPTTVPPCNTNGAPLTGTPWARQSEVTFDEFNINGNGKQSGYEFTMVDHSYLNFAAGVSIKGEMCMTYQRFGPGATAGGKPDNALSGSYGEQKEYQFFVVANHHYMPGHNNQDCRVGNP